MNRNRTFFYALSALCPRCLYLAALVLTPMATTMATPATEVRTDADGFGEPQVNLSEITILSGRVSEETPMAFSLVGGEVLKSSPTGTRELPQLLQLSPSVTASSDNGLGIGTCYIKVRGTTDSRINFTLDGVPMNNPEDQSLFWANMNSYSGSLDNIQIQRGVGTSVNGSGAFGATVSMETEPARLEPDFSIETSTGSYNTYSTTVKGCSGLLFDKLVAQGRFSYTQTDGYVDRTKAKLGSYFGSLTWLAEKHTLRLKNFGSFENTGQAWNGVPSDSISAGNRTFNTLGIYKDTLGRTLYTPTTDHYWQNHTHLTFARQLSGWELQATLHYNFDTGYYQDMKGAANLQKKFGLNQFAGRYANANRQKRLTSHTAGGIMTLKRSVKSMDLVMGGAMLYHYGLHYGEFESIEGIPTKGLRYYTGSAHKSDANVYTKATWNMTGGWHAFADLQYRFVNYRLSGENDTFLPSPAGGWRAQQLDHNHNFFFFNPKAGVSWLRGPHKAYVSYARTHREPTRNNYTDSGTSETPHAESMDDLELGYSYTGSLWRLGVNLYHMDYKEQLIATGRLSDIGEPLTSNLPSSFRQGVEFESSLLLFKYLNWGFTATLSRNFITNFTEYIDNFDGEQVTLYHKRSHIPLSPSLTAANLLSLNLSKWDMTLATYYVGRQYLDISSCKERMLSSYCVSDFTLGCTFYPSGTFTRFTMKVSNLFNAHYATHGWVYTAVSENGGYTLENRYTEDGLFVQAPRTFTFSVQIQF